MMYNNLNKAILFLFIQIFTIQLTAQFHFSYKHYTSDNGLSQNNITALIKDKKGYMWIGTRDGLCRFDGYSFKNYTSLQKNDTALFNKRIVYIAEDNRGYIWIKTYDDLVYRLETDTEMFLAMEKIKPNFGKTKIKSVLIQPSGIIWLTTFDRGCFSVSTDRNNILTVKEFNKKNNKLKSDIVNSVFEDKEKNTWILTQKGLCKINNNGQLSYLYEDLAFQTYYEADKHILFGGNNKLIRFEKRNNFSTIVNLPENVSIHKIVSYSHSNYIIITRKNGFFTFNALSAKLTQYTVEKYPNMLSNEILDVYIDRAGLAWLSIKSPSIIVFNWQSNTIFNLSTIMNVGQVTNPNIIVLEDEKDVLWVQPYHGTFSWYNRATNKLIPLTSLFNSEINNNLTYGVNHVISDSQGILWLSTNRGNGFYKCTFLPEYFNHILVDTNSPFNIANEIRAIYEDREKRLWIATKAGNVHVFDQNQKQLGTLRSDGKITKGGVTNMLVYSVFQDIKGNIWLATKKQGLIKLLPERTKNSFTLERFIHNPSDPYSIAHNDIYTIDQDKMGRIWIGSFGAGLQFIEEKNNRTRFIHAKNELKSFPISNYSKVRQVYADSHNNIWVATTEGLLVFKSNFNDNRKIKFRQFVQSQYKNCLSANDIHCITEDTEGNIWVGTFGGGIDMLNKNKIDDLNPEFEVINKVAGLQSNIVYAIIDDKKGNIWLTTENDIVSYNKKSKKIQTFGEGNEIERVEFSEASVCMKSSGEICIGSKSGYFMFYPETVKRKIIEAPLVFTRLLVFNKEVSVETEGSVLNKTLDNSEKIEFNHKQNVFTIEFATLDMRSPEKIQYAYILEGFENEWNYVQTKNFATYTALPPGNYTFKVKSTDSEGEWLHNERKIEIEVNPSFWQSIYAKILLFLLIIAIFLITLYVFITIFKLKNNVQLEKQMTDMKLRFFTDISHELRTPLTLIALPVENLLNEVVDTSTKQQLNQIKKNVDKVLLLINQILDFRKLQNNKMRLTVEEIEFGSFVGNCTTDFLEMAHAKNININIIDETNDVKVWVDPEKLDSIINNLVSNAIKFTPAGKNIFVKTVATSKSALLYVIDEGIGIEQEKINFIFDRFFSTTTFKNLTQKSTGIGLDLVKKLIELHHASIKVESQLNKGSVFEVEFNLGLEHYNNDVDIIVTENLKSELYSNSNEIVSEIEHNDKFNPLILIVEDNDELRHFLMNSLRNNYRVAEAENGLVGWSKIESLLPDIVIADLRMPEMDGIELTIKVRNDNRTSHIPVILLTAVTDNDSKVSGISAGADDYIIKPFNSAFLHARIENLIKQRKQLQAYYKSKIGAGNSAYTLPPIESQSQDEAFMKNVIEIMADNIENFDLSIEVFSRKVNMSRSVFYNKIKSLTGYSPVEFIREVRLQRACEFITQTQLTVSEVSYRVGFDDPRYFSRCFKHKFGLTPSEYRLQNNQQ